MSSFLAAGGFDPLSFDPAATLLTTLTLLVLVILLTKFLWKPMLGAIEEREDRIDQAIKKAEEDRRHAEELLSSYNERVANVEQEIADLRNKAQADMDDYRATEKAKADAEASSRLDRAMAEIDGARTEAIEAIRKEAVSLGMAVASKVVGKAVDQADHQRLADDVVAGLTGVGEGAGV